MNIFSKTIIHTLILTFLGVPLSVNAQSCRDLLQTQPPVSTAATSNQKKAEAYAQKMQSQPFSFKIRKRFYRFVTGRLLKKNLGTNRLSEETTKDVYDETVTRIKALLGSSLITDQRIAERNTEIQRLKSRIDTLPEQNSVKEKEITTLTQEIAALSARVPSQNQSEALILSSAERDSLINTLGPELASKANSLRELEEELGAIRSQITQTSETLREVEVSFKARKALRNELSKDLFNDLKEYRTLPNRIQRLIDTLMVREQRLEVLRTIKTPEAEEVELPELNADGEVVWPTKKYNSVSAENEIAFLEKEIKERKVRIQIRDLLNEQSSLHQRLTIYKDYLMDAKGKDPSSFGPLKERLLQGILAALALKDNFPGYKALLRYERKIFIEEFLEAYNIGSPSQTPQERLRTKLQEEGGAAVADFREVIGGVKNSTGKQIMNSVKTLLLPLVVSTGLTVDKLPTSFTDARQYVLESTTKRASVYGDRVLFYFEGLFFDHHRTVNHLLEVPKEDRQAWLEDLITTHNIDITTYEGSSVIRSIVRSVEEIETANQAQESELEADKERRRAILESLLD